MEQQEIIAAMEQRAKACGLSMAKVCDAAGVARSTFSRWKLSDGNPNPIGATIASLAKLERIIREYEEAERVAA